MPPSDQQGGSERPDYKVYRARPKLLSRLTQPDLGSLREKLKPSRDDERPRREPRPVAPGRRRWLRWIAVAAGGWLLLSFVMFAISSQIQKAKLQDSANEAVTGGNPFLAASPQTILMLGSDRRDELTAEPTFDPNAPSRADTIMLIRAGGGVFRKLSIPRDTYAAIPGHNPQKINAAYALDDTDANEEQGNTSLMVETVEQFLGLDVDHVVLVDFEGFRDFIDSIGGVEVDLDTKVCSVISGGEEAGGFEKNFGPGEETLTGNQALILARTRTSACPEETGGYDDLDRAATQQKILSGIKGRLTSPLRLPYNFIRGPWIGWSAPKAIISDMGALTMPQLVLAAVIGGDSDPKLLEPSGPGPLGSLIVPQAECQDAAESFLGKPPPRPPACSPVG